MEFTDFMYYKLIAIAIACAIYGFWQGFTGQ